jgi:hypothetical protein
MCDYRRGFDLGIEFIDHLCTQLLRTSNYNSLTELHTTSFTVSTAHIKYFLHSLTFNWLFLQTPVQNYQLNKL